ncbi:hypothetical protein CFK39_06420 [Brachybacterium avium]|uniref:Ribosomally synthesized peptide with SipW-like signal peptide n=1 Tax=Brachybacterium avium TaxID=2017485 RepID=A0A220UBE1_9MICO|nr:SipW-dependent-type signal peptide-containing protein [Brachybacterium avium]ASK65528.1 hypothetical protein CFK39_06420 [Brachybacterium avium]
MIRWHSAAQDRAPNSVSTPRRRRWKQIRALLAGGLVFGFGASATMAAWTDTEAGTGEFQAGAFLLEANINGSWASTGQMTFTTGAMYPGAITYAPVRLRTTPDTTVAGNLTLTGTGRTTGSGVIADSLEYRTVVRPAAGGTPPTCDAGAFTASATYAFGSSSSWQPMAKGVTSPSTQHLEPAQSSTLQYCFAVRLRTNAPNTAQGTRAGYTWTWDATSVTPG